jgi:hypothetical protein
MTQSTASDRGLTHDALKELAGRIMKLSYTDMKKFTDVFTAKNGTSVLADRLVATAEQILQEDVPRTPPPFDNRSGRSRAL